MPNRDFLGEVYGLNSGDRIREFYDEWSDEYDDTVLAAGYTTPKRCAEALASKTTDRDIPILDFGCGTGISGQALSDTGFTAIDGCDLSEAMLDEAKRKSIYRFLLQCTSSRHLPFKRGAYSHIAAIGAIGIGAASPMAIDRLMGKLPPMGTLTMSLNDHTLQVPEYEMRVAEYVDTGAAEILFKDYGEHLPGIDLKSVVYVLRRR